MPEIEEDVVIIVNRFATEEFALSWRSKVMSMKNPIYRKISSPYFENTIKYASIAVDCEKVIPKRSAK